MKLKFRNLPFSPEKNEIIYVENTYNDEINNHIREEIDYINEFVNVRERRFVYLPLLKNNAEIRRQVEYYAPYLSTEITYPELPQSSFLLDYLDSSEDRDSIAPTLLAYIGKEDGADCFYASRMEDITKETAERVFMIALLDCLTFDEEEKTKENPLDFGHPCCGSAISGIEGSGLQYSRQPSRSCSIRDEEQEALIEERLRELEEEARRDVCRAAEEAPKQSWLSKKMSKWLCSFCEPDEGDNDAPAPAPSSPKCAKVSEKQAVKIEEPYEEDDIRDIMWVLDKTVKELRMKGVTLMAIHEMIDKHEKLSRIVITPDYRIILPDYNDMEIEMGVLPKALFFLFLRYPEGIRLKEMQDHYTELYNIYSQLKPNFKEARLRLTITEVVNPLNNRINENIARVRAAFLKKFDEHLAQHYFIHGTKGETYGIDIDRNLIEWQEDDE